MGLFSDQSTEGHEENEDRIGGGGGALPSDMYLMVVKVMYVTLSNTDGSKAKAVNVIGTINGKEHRETIWVTDKEGKNWFPNKQDKTKRVTLPGYATIDDLCIIGSGKDLAAQDTEDKIVNIYDFDAKKELPKSVPVLTNMTGAEVLVALQEVWENRREKRGTEYVDIADYRKFNQIAKTLDNSTKLTVIEATKAVEADPKVDLKTVPTTYHDGWLERNKGKPYDKRSIKDGQAGGSSAPKSSGSAPASSAAPRQSLFGKS